ncbi:MAG: Hsp70 family protein [Sandaracinaceae bacterium]|nr:Hsp70 family protein [Sandaracinaceae bacterium]
MGVSYAVGIDLGTTHSALAYVDLDLSEGEDVALHVARIPQHVAVGQLEERFLLPSFIYLPHPQELPPHSTVLPWRDDLDYIVGELARELGAKTPIRLVSSAKSWLCHGGVDRRAPILPPPIFHDEGDIPRISPLEASTRYLIHLHDAWNHAHPDAPLQEQDVVITVPASFDPGARELTSEAAERAGLGHAVLLEEPQAAFYAWIEGTKGQWRKQVRVGDVVLVIDLGGGTTDFSLIAVSEEGGSLVLSRIAVGDHILLGGDNMDLALASYVRRKLEEKGHRLDGFQVNLLTHACRIAKEKLLSKEGPSSVPIVIPGRGSRLVGGSIRTELSANEVESILVDGFFPFVHSSERPQSKPRGAIRTMGLPYAQDPAITRHLAAFLSKHVDAARDLIPQAFLGKSASFIHPSAVLFNGGVLKSEVLARRIFEVLSQWIIEDGGEPPRLLEGADLDLAVAKGAAYYAYVRRGKGVRIRGGIAKSYYVGIEGAVPAIPGMEPPLSALCIAPFGLEEGISAPPAPQLLGLVVGEPVAFRFFESATRRDDQPGTIIERIEELQELPSIEAILPADPAAGHRNGDIVPVRLQASVTELGVLRLEAISESTGERWKIEFDVRR